jgi:hypothetical protein
MLVIIATFLSLYSIGDIRFSGASAQLRADQVAVLA